MRGRLRWLVVAGVTCSLCASNYPLPTTAKAQQATAAPENDDVDLDILLADYRQYGLPIPPDDAKLVRFESGVRYILNGVLMPPTFSLGFLLRRAAEDRPGLVLAGTSEVELAVYKETQFVEPKPEIVETIENFRPQGSVFAANERLALALQLQARGCKALAKTLYTSGVRPDPDEPSRPARPFQKLPSRSAVAHLAWAYHGNELFQPGTDRAKSARQMENLLAAEPLLDTETYRQLLRSLNAALVPSTAKPGTVERLIDELVEMSESDMELSRADPRYVRLAARGFAAVPDLIEHLDDPRLTRSVEPAINNCPARILKVENVASSLLRSIAGTEASQKWSSRAGYVANLADVETWWEQARSEGEEAYCVRHVLPVAEKDQWPNAVLLAIIADRYPDHLPRLYRTILDQRPQMESWPVAEAIAKSSLPDDEKRALFRHAADHENLEHRRVGLKELRKLDPPAFIARLLATLEDFPATPQEPYWSCREAAIAQLVMETDDDRAWTTLERVARRSDVGLRMQFMNPMDYSYLGDRQRKRRLDFLAGFLQDADTPDVDVNPTMFSGPHASFTFRRLEVRDLAAMKIASILGMPEQPDRDWTPEQWVRLRAQVNAKLKQN